MAEEMITIKDDEKYVPTQKGREYLKKFMARYSEYLTMFDIFCAVDLESGEFAFEDYNDYDDDKSFQNFLNEQRWDDLRVAVASYKGVNPIEIVFMSFISEQRFGRNESGWQFDLLLGSVWDEILEICETAIQWEQLGYQDEQGKVPAEDVIEDIITQGTEIMLGLLEEEFKPRYSRTNGEAHDAEYHVDEVDFPDYDKDYYKSYLDPKYVSKNWKN